VDWLIAGTLALLINLILYFILSHRINKQYNTEAFLSKIEKDMNALLIEMNNTSERNISVFEDRVQKLKDLIAELDARLLLLDKQEKSRLRSDQQYSNIQNQIREVKKLGSYEHKANDVAQAIEAPKEALEQPVRQVILENPGPVKEASKTDISRAQISESIVRPSPVNPADTIARDLRQFQKREVLKQQVFELSQAGLDTALIARQTGLSAGEIELIISLGKNE